MIKKLRRQFVGITLLTLTLAMVLVVGIVNLSNWFSVRQELLNTVALIADSENAPPAEPDSAPPDSEQTLHETSETPPPFPENGDDASHVFRDQRYDRGWSHQRLLNDRHARNMVTESIWFSVVSSADGTLTLLDSRHNLELPEETCLSLASQALSSGKSSGFIGDYVFRTLVSSDQSMVVLMNAETRFAAVRTLLLISGLACVGGILLAFFVAMLASRKAIQPTLRNMEQQKRFITDASHELKTPLTVISTNMQLLSMETPDNPWVESTRKQTASLRRLVDELVYLSRLEEENPNLTFEPLQIAALIREVAEPYEAMAEFNGSELIVNTDESLWINGDAPSVTRMLSTLCDNAAKYAVPEEPIRISAVTAGRHVRITISNGVSEPFTPEQCRHLFDRFYRADPSRSKGKKSGFGIGLSIAAAVAEKHGGSVSAEMESDQRLALSVLLPRISAPSEKK